MSDLFWLSNAAWNAIEPHLPKNQPRAYLIKTFGFLRYKEAVTQHC